jgi:hypothetical protein
MIQSIFAILLGILIISHGFPSILNRTRKLRTNEARRNIERENPLSKHSKASAPLTNNYIRTNNHSLVKSLVLKIPSKISHPSISLEGVLSPNLFMKLVAGTSVPGNTGDPGPVAATAAQIQPCYPWVDQAGNIFLPMETSRIRKVTAATGQISLFGGTGGQSLAGTPGPIESVVFFVPTAMVGDAAGTYHFISDRIYVWKCIINTRDCSVGVGSAGSGTGFLGDGGPVGASLLFGVVGLWLTTQEHLYLADTGNHRIRKVVNSVIDTIAGSGCDSNCVGSYAGDTGFATSANLKNPQAVYVNSNGRIFIADTKNHRIRVVETDARIYTFAGTGTSTPFNGEGQPRVSANINLPTDVKGDSLGNIYFVDSGNYVIRVVEAFNGMVSTLFGSVGVPGFSSGISDRKSAMNTPIGLWLDSTSTMYFTDGNSLHQSVVVSSPTSQPTGRPSRQPSGKPSSQPSSRPSRQPSTQPSGHPTGQPSSRPSQVPTSQPSRRPSSQPSSHPTGKPSTQPTSRPSLQPFGKPSSSPSCQPSSRPSMQPSAQPSRTPSSQPSEQPTTRPTMQPTSRPSLQPFSAPSSRPSTQPTVRPTTQPSSQPTRRPSAQPSSQPSGRPTLQPTGKPTTQPSSQPSVRPSSQPTCRPSTQPSSRPSKQPSSQPSEQPTTRPTKQPSVQPSSQPVSTPTSQPTSRPSCQPTTRPSAQPTMKPTNQPSSHPSSQPTRQPTRRPTTQPSSHPSSQPTTKPSTQPSNHPTTQPTTRPTRQPSSRPSFQPTIKPSLQPSNHPTTQPTTRPTKKPSSRPSSQPTTQPSRQPTGQPSCQPSSQPIDNPSSQPTSKPSKQPSSVPSSQPSGQPISCPSSQPSALPTWQPTSSPTVHPSGRPTSQPSSSPSTQPTDQPSSFPSSQPTNRPTTQPISFPTSQPSGVPSHQPTRTSSSQPTGSPSGIPSDQPTSLPSSIPSIQPSSQPSRQPTVIPTVQPNSCPSSQPSSQPSSYPTNQPTGQPSLQPFSQPSSQPTTRPSQHPTSMPSIQPSVRPSCQPTAFPTNQPSGCPTTQPTSFPSSFPSSQPSKQPMGFPSALPSAQPSRQPSERPSNPPSSQPSSLPSTSPTAIPSNEPSNQPTSLPTRQPSSFPSSQPTSRPSRQPYSMPSVVPSGQPLSFPTYSPSNQPTTKPSKQPISGPTSSPSTQPSRIPSAQPFSFPTAAPVANIYQTKGVLFFLGTSIYSNDQFVENHELLGSFYVLFGRNFRYEGRFPSVLSLENNKEYVSLLNDGISGITSDAVTRSTTIIGDVNNDGFLDQLMGLPLDSKSMVFLGNSIGGFDNSASFSIIGDPEDDGGQLGWAAARVGDLNRDGFDEIVVSAPYGNIVCVLYGRKVFNSDIFTNDLKVEDGFKIIGSLQDTNFGVAVALVHDFNNDNNPDIAITAVRPGGENVIYVLIKNFALGKEGNIQIDDLVTNNECFRIFAPYLSYAGFSIAGIGDLNNDGFNDLAIGSIPINNAKYGEQRTYIVYGRKITSNTIMNTLYLSTMTPKDGFIIRGGGFLVAGVGDVNADGIADVMIASYYDWKGKGDAYLISYPVNATYSPTIQPTLTPSIFPSSVPSASASSDIPSSLPSASQTTFYPSSSSSAEPTSSDSSSSAKPVTTRSPTKLPSRKPSRLPSFAPSRTSKPTSLLTLEPTPEPTPLPTALRVPPSAQPIIITSTTKPTQVNGVGGNGNLRSRSPSSPPTPIHTAPNITEEYTEVDCSRSGDYEGKNATNYKFLITINSGAVSVTGSDLEGVQNLFILRCPIDRVTVVITNFRLSTDVLSVAHLSEEGKSGSLYPSMNEISYSLKGGPLTLLFCSESKLQVILSSHNDFDLKESNFLFASQSDNNGKGKNNKDEVLAQVQIAIALSILVLLFLMVCISKGSIDPDKLKKTDDNIYLETAENDPSSLSSPLLSSPSSSPSSMSSPSPDAEIPRSTSDSESLHSSLFSLRSSTVISENDDNNEEEEEQGVEPQSNDDSLGSELMALFHDFSDKSDDSKDDEEGEEYDDDDDEDSLENLERESLKSGDHSFIV